MTSKLRIKVRSITVCIAMLFALLMPPIAALAQSAVVLQKGQVAPYTGLLLSKEAGAQIVAHTEQRVELQKAQCTLELGQQSAKHQAQMSLCSLELKNRLNEKQKQLDEAIAHANEARWIWGSVGAIVGIVVGGATVKLLWK
jgi:hypothetical protein